jgi:hypothetical protein
MTTPTTVPVRLQLRADTAANWTSINPILLANELGRETDTGKIKIGNGTSTWTSLAYQAWATLPVAVNAGGTGQTSYTNGQLLIGNTTGNTLTKATLTAGSGVAITNGTGSITVAVDSTVVTTAQTGTVTSTMIADGTIVNADINASAAIAGTKISPDFGSQNVVTTGTSTAASLIPTGSSVPGNGVYLPAANSVGISTNSVGRVFVNSAGNVGIGTTSPQANCVISKTGAEGVEIDPAISSGLGRILFFNRNTNAYTQGLLKASVLRFDIETTERARIDSSGRLLVGTASDSGGALLQVNGNRIRIATANTPASASATGTTGEIAWDADYIYVCTATNTWKRTAISTW